LYRLPGCLVRLPQPAHQIRREENKMKKEIFWDNVLTILQENLEPSTYGGLGLITGLEIAWGNYTLGLLGIEQYLSVFLICSLLVLLFRLLIFTFASLGSSILFSIKVKRIILQDEDEVSAIRRRIIYHALPEEEQKKLQSYMENLYETFHDRPIELGGKNRDI
jgi:hypothetical protein